jgi:hypothetical protein
VIMILVVIRDAKTNPGPQVEQANVGRIRAYVRDQKLEGKVREQILGGSCDECGTGRKARMYRCIDQVLRPQ